MKKFLFFILLSFWVSAFSQSGNICMTRLHSGFAEILIPVSQWSSPNVTLKVYRTTGAVAATATYSVGTLTTVTSNGTQYYYIKGLVNSYGTETLKYEVSGTLNTAVSNTLAALPESSWNIAGTAETCVTKADVCFNRVHHGFADILIPVNQWNGSSITLKIYHPNNTIVANATYNIGSLPKVLGTNGQQYYYIKGLATSYYNAKLTYEVSSPLDAAVCNTLAALLDGNWSVAGTTETCAPKADVCFNRVHHGYADILIPVNQWNGSSVTLKIYHPNNTVVANVTYNIGSLTKVSGFNGQQYYYIKGLATGYYNAKLTYEVSSPLDIAVSNTLVALPDSSWSVAGTTETCASKADVCFNRLHHGYADVLIPVDQWNGSSVTFKVYHPSNTVLMNTTYNVVSLPKVLGTNGQQYYYIKGITTGYYNAKLTYEVSSPLDVAISNTLDALPDSDWNNFAKQELCMDKADGICMNRNNANYTIFIPVSEWVGNSATLKLYHPNNNLITTKSFTNMSTELNNGVPSYKIVTSITSYSTSKLIAEVSSVSNAAVHMYLDPVQQLCYANGCSNPVNPTFSQVNSICQGEIITLPATSNNGITGTWSPPINNQATTTYTFTPTSGQCATTTTMAVDVNPNVSLILSSGTSSPTLEVNTPISPIVCTIGNGVTGVTVTGLPAGISYTLQGNGVTISGTPTVAGTFSYTISTVGGCGVANLQGTITVLAAKDWRLSPNSYIFTGKDTNGNDVDGLYIPVNKAYKMWSDGNYIGGGNLANVSGAITADVLWEDNIGLIKSGSSYALEVIGIGENAQIKVPINKVKEGNAVVAYKINGEVYWSWHIWVTDDPTNGSTYKSYNDVKRELNNGTVEIIPNNEWGWMDRNLGAIGGSINGDGWNKNGGLMYQWGRKDPLPPLANRDASFYQVTGSAGKIVYDDAAARLKFTNSPFNDYKNFNSLIKFVNQSAANITNNIKLSVKNPLSLIYVVNDGTTTLSTYGTSSSVPYYYNWFGTVSGLNTDELSKVNLWSDNSKGLQAVDISIPQPYRNKSSYDPCPNGWRLPSALVATATKNLRMDFTPFGPKVTSPLSALNGLQSNVPPGLSTLKPYLAGIKVFPNYGFDMSNVAGNNIGVFPGTGYIGRGLSTDGRYHAKATFTDQHETYIWTSTMTTYDGYSSIAGALRLTPDATQIVNGYKPDATNYSTVYGLYSYKPAVDYPTNNAQACRCIKDPLFVKNNYDFETTYFTEHETYIEGLDNPNTYMITKSSADQVISIPVSKAFSVQSNYLGNTIILNPSNYNDLKANVLWTDNTGLITQLTIDNPSTKNANINVKINANTSGNAVVTLHNGSIANPIYWSWHIWVTNTDVASVTYTNDTPIATDNYMNYTQYGTIMKTTIMDRNLGAKDVTPTAYSQSSAANVLQLNNSQGLHYQWGRKDPLPTFTNIAPNNTKFNVALGSTTNGVVTYPTVLSESTYNSTNVVDYNTYKSGISTTDKIDVRIQKILGYSVANPLKFLKPTVVYPTRTDITYNLGSDWLFDTNYHGLYDERWGLGGEKSVFDPCPAGWRIPETGTSLQKSSPWSLKNNYEYIVYSGSEGQTVGNSELGYYGSVISYLPSGVTSPWGRTVGFLFGNSLYNVGAYPKGYIRGKRSVLYPGTLNNTIDAASAGGFWYANLQQNLTGRGTFMSFDRFNRILVKQTDVDPYAAMNCRCVKQDDNGVSRGPVPGIPVTQNTGTQAKSVFTEAIIQEKIKNELVLYPNPVKDTLYIDATDSKEYYYQIYNMAGQLVKESKFNDKQTDISQLPTGIYLVRINNSEKVVKIIKQ